MNKIINIKNIKAISDIEEFKKKKYIGVDIKFINVHLKNLNDLTFKNIFNKNNLYINSVTLWELMQPLGNQGSHNFHSLLPEDIYYALNNLTEPYCIINAKFSRYAVVPSSTSSFNELLMVIIEVGSGLFNNSNANINKIVTIYPKSELDKYLDNLDNDNILFRK